MDVLKRTVEEIPVPVAPKITEGHIHKKKCRNCGKVFIPPQNEMPLKGKFGINLMIPILMMKFVLRGRSAQDSIVSSAGICLYDNTSGSELYSEEGSHNIAYGIAFE
ncbi:MAG: hypothetical protein M1569_03395 [Candidatus Marsarchaeota archaeon]|nr:hypothetical protein [Candidatus Marsarchaeota archaeon]